jgi:hypothetical protein
MLRDIEPLSMAQKLVLIPLIVIVLFGLISMAIEKKQENYLAFKNWNNATPNEQLAWINGLLTGLEYVAKTYVVETGDSRIIEFLPRGVTPREVQEVVNKLYRIKEYRGIPLVDIVVRYSYWAQFVKERSIEEDKRSDSSGAKA